MGEQAWAAPQMLMLDASPPQLSGAPGRQFLLALHAQLLLVLLLHSCCSCCMVPPAAAPLSSQVHSAPKAHHVLSRLGKGWVGRPDDLLTHVCKQQCVWLPGTGAVVWPLLCSGPHEFSHRHIVCSDSPPICGRAAQLYRPRGLQVGHLHAPSSADPPSPHLVQRLQTPELDLLVRGHGEALHAQPPCLRGALDLFNEGSCPLLHDASHPRPMLSRCQLNPLSFRHTSIAAGARAATGAESRNTQRVP